MHAACALSVSNECRTVRWPFAPNALGTRLVEPGDHNNQRAGVAVAAVAAAAAAVAAVGTTAIATAMSSLRPLVGIGSASCCTVLSAFGVVFLAVIGWGYDHHWEGASSRRLRPLHLAFAGGPLARLPA